MIRRNWRWLVVGILLGGAAKMCFGFVGVPLLFAPPVVTTATGVALSTWAAIAGGVGALLYSIGLQDTNGNEFLGVRINPSAPQKVPSGWTASSTAGADPNPPATAGSPVTTYYVSGVDAPPGVATALQACLDWYNGGANGHYGNVQAQAANGLCSGTATCLDGTCGGAGRQITLNNGPYTTVTACPTGYTVNSSNVCVLSSPTSVPFPADGRCGLTLSGGVMSYDSRDPDCSGTAPAGIVKSSDGKTVTASNPTQQIKIQVNADGSIQVTAWSPSANNPNQTVVNIGKIAAPSSGTSTQLQTATQGTVNGVGIDAFTVTPTSSQQSFPDDYSREQTQQSVLSKLGEVKTAVTDLTKSSDAPSDPVAMTADDITSVFFPDTFTSLRSWQLPARAVSCPTWSFSVFSHSYTIDAHCSLIEQQRGFFSSIMLLVWSLAALFIVLGA